MILSWESRSLDHLSCYYCTVYKMYWFSTCVYHQALLTICIDTGERATICELAWFVPIQLNIGISNSFSLYYIEWIGGACLCMVR